jgi:hypothetical protein
VGRVRAWLPIRYGKIEVRSEIVSLSAQHISIRRHDDRDGEIVVHFPRGFRCHPKLIAIGNNR